MDTDMDMDIDLTVDDEAIITDNDASILLDEPANGAFGGQPDTTVDSAVTSTVESGGLVPHKVHIRGVDNLRTSDILAFANEHFPSQAPTRPEWIDDSSANLVYDTPAIAIKALKSFSSVENDQLSTLAPTQLRPARGLSTHPDSRLEVRLAVVGDRKQPGARERSRFYLFNPEEDPAERRRREGQDGRRRTARSHEDSEGGNYRRRRYSDREERRRKEHDVDAGYDVNMYDDDASLGDRQRRPRHRRRYSSHLSSPSVEAATGDSVGRLRFGGGAGKELFPGRSSAGARDSRQRDRSASPEVDGDGDRGMRSTHMRTRSKIVRERSYSPPIRNRQWVPSLPADAKKELFPARLQTGDVSSLGTGDTHVNPQSKTAKVELFPQKVNNVGHHRRSDAFDAADETADLFAGRMGVPFVDGGVDGDTNDAGPSRRRKAAGNSRSLADRITRSDDAPRIASQRAEDDVGFSVRGAAKQQQQQQQQQSPQQGFQIRGAATKDASEPFSGRLGSNTGKELFMEKVRGAGPGRRRAEDMFYE
ncbi:MAG: hypothetical protein M1825_000109 [Sarcosagium campestre]|nr:MAG: hypothetical protein M1825_000109 [Sarcosagium campestre]